MGKTISFYPGPSRVHDEIADYVRDAHREGILSINHRSEEFMKICERTVTLLKKKLSVPREYTVFFTSSATECWEIIAQSWVTGRSYHVFNGSFGQKWYEYSKRIAGGARKFPFEREELVNTKKLRFGEQGGVICITQNETSNGTQVSNASIAEVKANNPSHLVAVDATSSMAGISLDFQAADIWFASVQKCFGLPAGLGIMICSPRAIDEALKIGEKDHYNSVTFMNEMMGKFQTPFTPNVLAIYLLMRVMKDSDNIEKIHRRTVRKYESWMKFLGQKTGFRHLVRNAEARSFTVIPIEGPENMISEVKVNAKIKGILLGEGYGDLKATTFRIANFPAIKKKEIRTLKEFLAAYKTHD